MSNFSSQPLSAYQPVIADVIRQVFALEHSVDEGGSSSHIIFSICNIGRARCREEDKITFLGLFWIKTRHNH